MPKPDRRRKFRVVRGRPRRLSLVPALLALSWAGACDAPAAGTGFGALRVLPVASPTGEASEEPFVSPTEDGVLMSWLEPLEGSDGHTLRSARYRNERWSAPVTVAKGERFFVNWADFPSVTEFDGVLLAHWLQRGPRGGYDYGVRVSRSLDGGITWSEPWTPHEDGTATEHGFVSVFPVAGGGAGLVWLDGRKYAPGPAGGEPTDEMALRFRTLGPDGRPGPEGVVDERVCDCCQTDAAVTSRGPVVVYRDREADEIRDIRLRRLEEGGWTGGTVVHPDGWRIEGCPVNGPAVAARGERAAVAWFTAAEDDTRVKVAFSGDAGDTFGEPVAVDDGDPVGRVDLALLTDGSALVSWLERTDRGAEIRVRQVSPDGTSGPGATVAASSDRRASGFPRMAPTGDGAILMAWTDLLDDGARVRLARVEVGAR